MKKLIALMLMCLSSYCLGQTSQVQHGGTGNNSTANHAILVGTGPSTYTLVILPDCLDTAGNHINYNRGSHSATCGTSTSGVTSVSQVNPTGVLSQTGGPIISAGTFTWSWSGTSGGLLCFTGSSTAASSGLLTTGNPVIGAGTGSCPTVGTRSGNTTIFVTASGSLPTNHLGKFNSDGNLVDGGLLVRGISFTIGDPGTLSALSATSTTTDYVTVPFGCTISAYNLAIDSGTITVKFWKIATGTAIPTSANSINTSGVSVSSGTAIHSTTVSDFTNTTIAAHDIMAMNVTAVSGAKFVNGVIECQ